MDSKVFAAEITATTNLPCAVTWKVIYSGQKNQPESSKVRAYHIQINAVGQQAAFEILSTQYGRSSNGFSNKRKEVLPYMVPCPQQNQPRKGSQSHPLPETILRLSPRRLLC